MENKLKKKKEKRFPFSIFHDLRQTKQASVLSSLHFCGFLVYRHFKIILIFLFARFPQNRKAEFHAGPFTPLYFFYAVQPSISFSPFFVNVLVTAIKTVTVVRRKPPNSHLLAKQSMLVLMHFNANKICISQTISLLFVRGTRHTVLPWQLQWLLSFIL